MRNDYATGHNIYNGGSPHATTGKVDPMGYIERELGNRRSQLAQNMLQNSPTSKPSQTNGQTTFPVNPKHVSLLAIKMLRRPM